jgi:hypothetical protein
MKALWLVPVFALTMFGADITGKWSGNIEVSDPSTGDKINTPVKVVFDQKDGTVSGKIGRSEDDQSEDIRNGKLEGNHITFDVQPPEATSAMKFQLVVVADDRIEGEMKGAVDVGNVSGKVTLQKVK